MLSVQKSPFDKAGLGFVERISNYVSHSTKFVPSSTKPKLDFRNPKEELLATWKIRVDLRESKPKNPNKPKGKRQNKPLWFCYFCGGARHTCPNCFKLQASKQAPNQKVPMPKAQDPTTLIHELVKALNLYSNARVDHQSNLNKNSNSKFASKKMWMQKTQSKLVFLIWSLCFIPKSFVTIFF